MRLLLAGALLAGAAAAEGVWFEDVRILRPGEFLDLDNGGVFVSRDTFPGGAPEVSERETFLVPREEDPAFADAAPPMSGNPWHRVRTSEGNLSWVQVLANKPALLVRFVTRLKGEGPPLPAPRSPFLRGGRGGIEVWFEPHDALARYRIERRAAPGEPFAEVGTVDAPPFRDRDVSDGVRYGYRVSGIAADGRAGVPAVLQGTTESRGVKAGRCAPGREDRGFDFLLGTPVASGGDLEISGGGGRFRDFRGQWVLAADAAVPDPRTPFHFATKFPVAPGDRFLVPLRGGGVARCTLDVEDGDDAPRIVLDYEAWGDGGMLPEAPRVEARREERGVAIRVEAPEPWVVREVQVTEVLSGGGPWTLRLESGAALDEAAKEGEIRVYTAVGLDRHGRRSPRGVARIFPPPTDVRPGEFLLQGGQGYSIEQQRIVLAGEADVVFEAHGVNIVLGGRGIRSLPQAVPGQTVGAIFEALVAAAPGGLDDTAHADPGVPASQVLLLHTRGGGWAKLAVFPREGNALSVRYVYNPRAPVFREAPEDATTVGGFTFARLD